jgi:hypothetical protein
METLLDLFSAAGLLGQAEPNGPSNTDYDCGSAMVAANLRTSEIG